MKSVRTILKYGAGLLFWIIVFGSLQYQCIFDITSAVDRLFVKNLHGDLVKNLTGEIALHVNRGRCVDAYFYRARYHPDSEDAAEEIKSLTSLIDVATWRESEADTFAGIYLDKKHRYVLFTYSDNEYIEVENRDEQDSGPLTTDTCRCRGICI